jgi:hypothetical protein
MAIMTSQDLINRMKELLNEPNFYGSGTSKWSTWQGSKGWYVDCTCSIKAILWGGRFIKANRTKNHAGCKYKSNNVPDFTSASGVKWTKATKGNWSSMVPGEIVWMTSHGHAGLYIGNGEVIEVTPAWTGGKPGCQVSKIGKNGERVKNGKQVYSWEYHGKVPVVDYGTQPTPPTPTKTIEELAKEVIAGKWGNGEERKRRLTEAGYDYRAVQNKVNEMLSGKKYIQLTANVWCRLRGYGFNYAKYQVIPKGTKCELLAKNVGKANGYNWDKVYWSGNIVYLPNAWNKYL